MFKILMAERGECKTKDKEKEKEARVAEWMENAERLFCPFHSYLLLSALFLSLFSFAVSCVILQALRTLCSDKMAESQHTQDLNIPERLTMFMGGGCL